MNLVESGGVYEELALGTVYDVSAHNNNQTFNSLSDLLTNPNLNTLIPSSIRKGGMSIKFIESNDNRYLQYRLMKNQWSTTVANWQGVDDEPIKGSDNLLTSGGAADVHGYYVEDEKWVYVLTDKTGKILAGIKANGEIQWSLGIPLPVKKYIDDKIIEIKEGTQGNEIDGLNKIISFLNGFSTSNVLQDLLNKKINGQYLDDSEYVYIVADKDGKIIESTDFRGKKILYDLLVRNELSFDSCVVQSTENREFVSSLVDKNGKLICGIKTDGTVFVSKLINSELSKATKGLLKMQKELPQLSETVDAVDEVIFSGNATIGILSQNPSNIILPKLQNIIFPYRAPGSAEIGRKVLSLLHFSDIHNYENNMIHITNFHAKFNEYIDDVIHTGDTEGNNLSTNISDKWGVSWLNCIGNHDAVLGSAGNYVIQPSTASYNKIFKPYIANWNVTQPSNAEADGKCYYYKDYDDAKVRLIVLDNYVQGSSEYNHWNATQSTWFQSVLAETLDSNNAAYGYHVVVAVHYPPFIVERDEDNTFQSIERENTYKCREEIPNIVQTFINNGGIFVCWITGHTHFDYNGFNADYPNQFVITIAGSIRPEMAIRWDDSNRVVDTKTEYCFNIMGIDTHNKVVKVLRVGSDTDMFMRSKSSFAYSYEAHKIFFIN